MAGTSFAATLRFPYDQTAMPDRPTEWQRRLHPRAWPIWVWVLLTLLAAALRVRYSFGAFSLAPAVALLAGSYLGPGRGAVSQAIALLVAATAGTVSEASPLGGMLDIGYHAGRVALAATAGLVAPADRELTGVGRRQLALVAALGLASGAWLWSAPQGQTPLQLNFAAVFALAIVIGLYYAWRLVPETGRLVAYLYSLLPYYAIALAWLWIAPRAFPGLAAGAGDARLAAVLFHGFLAHVPPDVLGAVLAAYLGGVRGERPLSFMA